MAEALVAEQLTVRRGSRAVVVDVSLRARFGEITTLIGPNGAGKSTLLRALLGLLPAAGTVHVNGKPMQAMDVRERAQSIAYVPQQSQLSASVRVREVVAQGCFAQGRCAASEQVERALSAAHVEHLADRSFLKLSGGEQRRALLARALATGARVLLLDEPTAGLDLAHVIRFHRLMRSLAERGFAILSVLHDLMDVYHHADRAILLFAGKVALAGPAREVVSSSAVERIYGVRLASAAAPFELVEGAR